MESAVQGAQSDITSVLTAMSQLEKKFDDKIDHAVRKIKGIGAQFNNEQVAGLTQEQQVTLQKELNYVSMVHFLEDSHKILDRQENQYDNLITLHRILDYGSQDPELSSTVYDFTNEKDLQLLFG
jgi:hypothetical protein